MGEKGWRVRAYQEWSSLVSHGAGMLDASGCGTRIDFFRRLCGERAPDQHGSEAVSGNGVYKRDIVEILE